MHTITVDDLATQGVRASSEMILTLATQNIPSSVPESLIPLYSLHKMVDICNAGKNDTPVRDLDSIYIIRSTL